MADDWREQPPLTRAVVGFADNVVTLSTDGVAYAVRMSGKAETFLDESIGFLSDARPLVLALTDAVESGLIEDVRRIMRITETTVNQIALVSARLDSAANQIAKILPTVDRTAESMKKVLPVIEGLPATQEDIRLARDAVQRVEALVGATISQLEAIPGARLVRGLTGSVTGSLTGKSSKPSTASPGNASSS